MIYFDNSATTPIHPAVLDTYVKTSQRILGNPSSLHSLGDQANRLLRSSRQQIAKLLSVATEEVYFTSGGTEGNNWVLKGTAIEKRPFGKHIIISQIEHPAVREAAKQLVSLGFELSELPVDSRGFVIPEKLESLLRKDTILVSVMAVNNEIGSIQPIQEISRILVGYPTVHFHVDAVQAIGKVPITRWFTSRVDFATFSAHKFQGPKGMGWIYGKEGKRIAPLLNGGGQEKGERSTTENVAGITAMAKAMRLLLEEEKEKQQNITLLKKYLSESLRQFEKVTIFSELNEEYAPHILCFALRGIRGEALVHAFEEKEIYISTTSACSSKQKNKESTLKAMQVSGELAESAVRISFDAKNTIAEVEQFMLVFRQLYQKFAKVNS